MQTIIVDIIILIAVCSVVYYAYKKLRTIKKNQCGSCSGCPLKENCSSLNEKRNAQKNGCEKNGKPE